MVSLSASVPSDTENIKDVKVSFTFIFFAVRRPLTVVASPVVEHRLRTRRRSGHGSRAQPLRGTWDLSRTGARTRVPCIGRRTLNHCATREAPNPPLLECRIDLVTCFQRTEYGKEKLKLSSGKIWQTPIEQNDQD